MARIAPVVAKRVLQATRVLAHHAKVRAAYVFGSQVEGTPDAHSDIDLAVFVEGAEQWDIFRRAEITALVQGEVGDDVELHYFPAQALEQPAPASFVAHVLHHGVQISDADSTGLVGVEAC